LPLPLHALLFPYTTLFRSPPGLPPSHCPPLLLHHPDYHFLKPRCPRTLLPFLGLLPPRFPRPRHPPGTLPQNRPQNRPRGRRPPDRKSTRLNSSHVSISSA